MMADSNDHLVILAGGTGTARPAVCAIQFMDVQGCGKSMLQLTLERFSSVVPLQNVWVVTSMDCRDIVAKQLPDVPAAQIVTEPERKGTAAAIAYACWKIKSRYPRANVVVTPSDCLIADTEEFARVVRSSLLFAGESDAIVTLGMKAERPEEAYGYIQADLRYATVRNSEIYRVDAFREKPSREQAESFIRQNNCFWNSGIFIWNVNTITNAFSVYQPDMSGMFKGMLPYYNTPSEAERVRACYAQCETLSVDRAVLENTEEIYVFPADFGWSDVGTWSSLRRVLDTDANGNACAGSGVETGDARNCFILSNTLRRIAVQGLDGYVVAEQNGELLICKIPQED